ncbi:hypothetical protein A0H81_09821 [Grifola frondosa]|uniref:Uncharacterized protein n=1 Tax=Grifola frondosa TaxID=5627 RepID=A0A1C7M0A9_GRIFR|nr:hypothetical protein A0H81_09821 [Grifola frondosa]
MSLNILRISRATRIHSTPMRLIHSTPFADPILSQGSSSNASHNSPRDPHGQFTRSGQQSGDKTPLDAALSHPGKKAARDELSGNPEGVGFAEQVGSQSATANKQTSDQVEGVGENKESTAPGFMDAIKSKLGLGAPSGEAKQNRRGGVTTTSKMPWDEDPGDSPKGNAGEHPTLPSHQKKSSAFSQQQHRGISTSAHLNQEKHTTDSYLKDVDESPPASAKTHQVDESDTGAKVLRPNEPVTGGYSRAGPQTKEYATVNKEDPYDVPTSSGPVKEQKLRYGGMPAQGARESGNGGGNTVSKAGKGPEGRSSEGRKSEGRQ